MAYHSFSLDPRTVLGVGPDALPEEIRDAYHAKSKKHHPDLGGDEWAFRMVARAYEVLKTTTGVSSSAPSLEKSWRLMRSTGRRGSHRLRIRRLSEKALIAIPFHDPSPDRAMTVADKLGIEHRRAPGAPR